MPEAFMIDAVRTPVGRHGGGPRESARSASMATRSGEPRERRTR